MSLSVFISKSSDFKRPFVVDVVENIPVVNVRYALMKHALTSDAENLTRTDAVGVSFPLQETGSISFLQFVQCHGHDL